ncbi:hypothetical protein DSL64_08340 [Dyadobacter luteus]|jgi:OOP family OmpA-OmpF porin|uniref:OmpA-like domain-containing protein n=1 Tax=Dyadobacter luteus TaxID=2259619 RepID=A0A3D8YEG6_9BACT|nr:OmpA family protein [Dyadobacter luteus]REA62910.1 hypothetical protein DSL64_08340 [Dyadobacter luteus]
MRSFLYGLICICIFVQVCHSQRIASSVSRVPRVSIRVVDKETLQPIDARILITNQHVDHSITPLFEDKSYKYKLTLTDTVNISIYAVGYHMLNESLVIGEINGVETYYLTANHSSSESQHTAGNPILAEEISAIIYFSQSNTDIAPRSVRHLERVGAYLQKNKVSAVSLQGHTDNVGDPQKNMLLSIDRNSVVRSYLLKSSDLDGLISSKSFGGSKPAAPNDCEQNKRFNRRVEVRLSLPN